MTVPPPAENGRSVAAMLASMTGLLMKAIEAGFAVVGFIVLVYILLGAASGPYVGSVIANLTGLITVIGPQTVVGVAIVLALLHLGRRAG